MATPEELFQQIQSYSAPTVSENKLAEMTQAKINVQKAQAEVDKYNELTAALSGASQGLTFGWADEAVAGLRSLFGQTSYADELAQEAKMRQQSAAAAPAITIGSEVVGSLAPTLLSAGIAAPGLASRLLLGTTGKAAPTIGQLAAIGATQGGLVGAGSAQPGERLVSGLMGAGIGGVAAPVVGKVAQYGVETLGTALAQSGTTLGSELGAINLGGAAKYTPAEIQLAKILSQVPPENLQTAKQAFIRAGQYGKPVFLPEAVESPALYQQAKLIANYPASTQIAKTAIEERAADAINRMANTLDVVSPDRNVNSGANKLVDGAKSLLNELGIARKEATKGLYEAAFEKTPQLTATDAVELVQSNPRIQQAIKAVKKELPELIDQPDTSLELLHQVQQYLSGRARAVKNKFTATKITEARSDLMTALKAESPDYAKATETFAKMSRGLTAKEQSKIGFLANVSPDKPGTIGRVFALDADVIASLRYDFEQAGKLGEWESGVRSYLQRALEQAQDNKNPINKIIGSPGLRDKLKAALGAKYDAIIEPLTIEQNILKGQREYFAGSPTEPLRQVNESLKESIGAIKTAVSTARDPVGTIGKFLSKALGGQQDEKFYQDYARLLFSSPEQGLQTLGNISKLTDALRAARVTGEKAGVAGGVAAGKEAVAGLNTIDQSAKSRQKQILSATGVGAAASSSELEDLFNQIQAYDSSPSTSQLESVRIGKQNVSIPKGEGYAPPEIVKAVIQVESAGKPTAVSHKGAAGLMQLMPSTAKDLGIKDRFDPEQNVNGGSRYLARQIQEFGNKELALAAYNWGPENIKRAVAKLKSENKRATWANVKAIVKVPKETREYVDKVLALI